MTFKTITNPKSKTPWKILCGLCIFLIFSALTFQFIFDMQPCAKCINQRIHVILLGLLFFIPIAVNNNLTRCLVYFAGFLTLIKSFAVSLEHSQAQHGEIFNSSCNYRPDLPSWLPLDNWIPFMFEVRGSCDQINWQFLNLTMPEWLLCFYLTTFLFLVWLTTNEQND